MILSLLDMVESGVPLPLNMARISEEYVLLFAGFVAVGCIIVIPVGLVAAFAAPAKVSPS